MNLFWLSDEQWAVRRQPLAPRLEGDGHDASHPWHALAQAPDPARRTALLVRLKQRLSEALGRPADVGTRDGLHPLLRGAIEHDTVRIFEGTPSVSFRGGPKASPRHDG